MSTLEIAISYGSSAPPNPVRLILILMTLPQGAPTEAPSAEDANMAEPLHPDLEEALWNSFQEGILATSAGQSPGGSTIPSTADLDDRRMKWPRNDGKGDGKPGRNPGNQGDGARQDSRQDWRARGRGDGYRRKAEDSWGSRWHEETPSSRELERLKTMVLNMQRLLLRHEDAINIWARGLQFCPLRAVRHLRLCHPRHGCGESGLEPPQV